MKKLTLIKEQPPIDKLKLVRALSYCCRNKTSSSLQEVVKKLAPNEEAAEEEATVAATINSLTQFLSNMHQEWLHAIDPALSLQMDQPLILQVCQIVCSPYSTLAVNLLVPLFRTHCRQYNSPG